MTPEKSEMHKITITTTSFAQYDSTPLELCRKNGYEIILNPYGRRVKPEELLELAKGSVGLIAGTESISEEILVNLSSLKVISRCGSGLDNLNLDAAKKLGMKVFSTPDAPTLAVAELTVALILALLRKIPLMDREIRTNLWKKRIGNLLCDKQVGIIGYGRIGRKVAELLKALGANVFYSDPFVREEQTPTFPKVEFRELLKKADIITLHLSYTKENHRLLGQKEFSLFKQGAFLVNCSRGGIVDEKALYSALKDGKIAGAAIDVFEQEPYNGSLRELGNVILTPHIGSYAKEARVEMEVQAVRNLLKGLKQI